MDLSCLATIFFSTSWYDELNYFSKGLQVNTTACRKSSNACYTFWKEPDEILSQGEDQMTETTPSGPFWGFSSWHFEKKCRFRLLGEFQSDRLPAIGVRFSAEERLFLLSLVALLLLHRPLVQFARRRGHHAGHRATLTNPSLSLSNRYFLSL